jgi:hypothetical protein
MRCIDGSVRCNWSPREGTNNIERGIHRDDAEDVLESFGGITGNVIDVSRIDWE